MQRVHTINAPVPLTPPVHVLNLPPSMRRHPVPVDANALIEDVLRRTRTEFTALTFLATQRLAALVAPTHIDAKVCERLPEVAEQTGVSVNLAMEVWEGIHRPLIRFVDLPTLWHDDRVAAVAGQDREDAPLAHLATLLAPTVVITRDRHLITAGLGQSDWLTTLLLLGELAQLDAMLWGGSRAVWLSLYLPGLGIGAIGRQPMGSELAGGIAIGVIVGAALFFPSELRAGATGAWKRAAPLLERLLEETTRAFDRRARAERALELRLVTATVPAAPEESTARLLIEHWDPIASEQIHERLLRSGHDISLGATRTMLRDHPAFVAIPGRGYQIGRSLSANAKGLSVPETT
jgi:hypothetical protein